MTNEELLKVIEEAKASGATTLDLSSQGFTTLSPKLFQLTNLTVLHLDGNELSVLPPEICQLTKIKKLWLQGNPLTSPPQEIALKGMNLSQKERSKITEQVRSKKDRKLSA